MKRITKRKLWTMVFSVILLHLGGCGKSPLFHHEKERKLLGSEDLLSKPEVEDTPVNGLVIFSQSQMLGQLEWKILPQTQGESQFILRTWKKGTSRRTLMDLPHTLFIKIWMPDMGHGSAPVSIQKIATGTYDVQQLYFIMPGYWDLHLQLKEQNHVVDEIKIGISI